jgi:peptidoglycan/xylan/chitin deacetylase (PgdA/CDA1 family)
MTNVEKPPILISSGATLPRPDPGPRPGPPRHRRPSHRRRRLAVTIGLAALLAAMVTAGVFVIGNRAKVRVVVRFEGRDRTVVVKQHHPTVAVVLAAGKITPRPGHLLGAKTHQAIAGHDIPPRYTLDGRHADRETALDTGNPILEVANGADEVEATTAKDGVAVPPPPIPRVEHYLWHPGTPGSSNAVVGVVSGEVVSAKVTTPPSSPAAVTDKEVALTLDDGPWPDTPQFLQVLQAKGIKATFCMIGRQVPGRAAIVKQVAAAGMTICNHTLNHNEHLDRAPAPVVESEVQGGIEPQVKLLGKAPTLYRPPGGALNALIEDVANQKGEQVIGWSVDPADYKKPGTPAIVAKVMGQVKPGAIILMHDGGGDRSQTLAALPVVIDQLKGQGYTFVTPDAVSPVPLGAPAAATPPTTQPDTPLGPEGDTSSTVAGSPPTTPAPPVTTAPPPSTPPPSKP